VVEVPALVVEVPALVVKVPARLVKVPLTVQGGVEAEEEEQQPTEPITIPNLTQAPPPMTRCLKNSTTTIVTK
jgi:hypothetical protein